MSTVNDSGDLNMVSIINTLLKIIKYDYDKMKTEKNFSLLNSGEKISKADLEEKFKSAGIEHIHFLDSEYNILSHKGLRVFLDESLTSMRKYISEKHDCDNYTFSLFGDIQKCGNFSISGSVGDIESVNGKHAFMIALTDSGLFIVEPQNNKMRLVELELIKHDYGIC